MASPRSRDDRVRASVVALVLFCAGAACGKPMVIGAQAGPGGAAGAGPGPGGAPTPADPGFTLPDAGPPADGGPPGALTPTMACASETHEARQVPLDLVLLVDTSGSMYELAGAQTKWLLTQNALRLFLEDPRSAGLGIGLQFFPLAGDDLICTSGDACAMPGVTGDGYCVAKSVCTASGQPVHQNRTCDPDDPVCPFGGTCTTLGRCAGNGAPCYQLGQACPGGGGLCGARPLYCKNIGTGSCTRADYERLTVPIAELPGVAASVTGTILGKEPIGHTPTVPAVEGTLNHLRQHLAANPGRRAALVLFTDGLPLGCSGGTVGMVSSVIAAAAAATPAISTHVIAIFAPNQINGTDAVNRWAMAGGTGSAIVLTPTEDLTRRFLDTLNQIRGAALPCAFTIPPQTGAVDFGKVNVRASGSAGAQDILYVERADRCDPVTGGWYYDVDPAGGAPSQVIICPASCTRFKADAATRLDLLFGCATRVIP